MTAPALMCGSCGTELPPNAKFCYECGAAVTAHDAHAEYKQVTVLFADVARSMDIAATVGAERLREIMAELSDRCAAVVQRYGSTVAQWTGDGVMAVFGAPLALEDHAVRACLAALALQEEVERLAVDVGERDGVELRLRVGLNSGQVIAGGMGSGRFGYATVGEQVGMAQRMESVAPPGGVMLSASTARLAERAAVLGRPELVRIKGADQPVPVRRLLGMADGSRAVSRATPSLVGRQGEMAAIEGLLGRAVDGHGAVVGVVGAPGIGKSRLVHEATALAADRGVDVFTAFCDSHTSDIPFRVVAQLLRATTGVRGLDDAAARVQVRAQFPGADPDDVLLLEDLLGIADPEAVLAKLHADARRRRLTAFVNAAALARKAPALYIVEDAHWIDKASESLLADFVSVIARARSLALISYRPEYRGALSQVPGAHSIALGPLSKSETAALVGELLGPDSSVSELATMITERTSGNPFFAEEMVRELAAREVLRGNRGGYVTTVDAGDISVPATVQVTIAARIDRLAPAAKRALAAAAVIGSKFNRNLLETLGIEPSLEDLVVAELVDHVQFTQQAEYVFHHPLIRTVAYDAQLKSERAEWHRRVAAAIESGDSGAGDENAALIAEHLQAGGDPHAAYGWHMRAAAWATNRDIAAAQRSWERAQQIADALPADEPNRAAMRIAPRTMLCGIAARVHENVAGKRFDELRELCAAVGDKRSLAIAMAGLVMDHAYQDRMREASQLASEHMALIESIGDTNLTVALSFTAIWAKLHSGEWPEVLRWSQRVIDLADGDALKGNFIAGSPLAFALTTRASARFYLGLPGWRDDHRHALATARSADPVTFARVVAAAYMGILTGTLPADDHAVREIEDALQVAERSGDDLALEAARLTLGVVLVHRPAAVERDRGRDLLAAVREVWMRRGDHLCDLPIVEVYWARERARRGDRDAAIPLMRTTVDHAFRDGRLLMASIPGTGVLVDTLLERGSRDDVAEADAAIERLAVTRAEERLVMRDIWVLRLRALLAHARRDDAAYADSRDRYRDLAKTLGFEGHIAWAAAMP